MRMHWKLASWNVFLCASCSDAAKNRKLAAQEKRSATAALRVNATTPTCLKQSTGRSGAKNGEELKDVWMCFSCNLWLRAVCDGVANLHFHWFTSQKSFFLSRKLDNSKACARSSLTEFLWRECFGVPRWLNRRATRLSLSTEGCRKPKNFDNPYKVPRNLHELWKWTWKVWI